MNWFEDLVWKYGEYVPITIMVIVGWAIIAGLILVDIIK